jgi:glycosyltransferase involved in cell wall biosynthesis
MVQIASKKLKNKYLFSIITPTYKRTHKLKKLYKRLLEQKRNNLLEWVLVLEKNDISTIQFAKKIRKQKKIEIKIVINTRGFSSAFKNGAKIAKGEFISFLGDDDILANNIFLILERKIISFNPNWIIGYGCYINNNGKKIRTTIIKLKNFMLRNFNKNILFLVDFIMTPSSFCKKKYLKKVGYFRNIHWYGNDYVCWIRLSKIIKPTIINKTLSYASYSNSTYSGSFDYIRYLNLYYNISKETNNILIKVMQFLIVIYILTHNFFLKKIIN